MRNEIIIKNNVDFFAWRKRGLDMPERKKQSKRGHTSGLKYCIISADISYQCTMNSDPYYKLFGDCSPSSEPREGVQGVAGAAAGWNVTRWKKQRRWLGDKGGRITRWRIPMHNLAMFRKSPTLEGVTWVLEGVTGVLEGVTGALEGVTGVVTAWVVNSVSSTNRTNNGVGEYGIRNIVSCSIKYWSRILADQLQRRLHTRCEGTTTHLLDRAWLRNGLSFGRGDCSVKITKWTWIE